MCQPIQHTESQQQSEDTIVPTLTDRKERVPRFLATCCGAVLCNHEEAQSATSDITTSMTMYTHVAWETLTRLSPKPRTIKISLGFVIGYGRL